jgi:peptidylprolyl isomerase
VRKSLALIASAAVIAALAGCSNSTPSAADCTGAAPSGPSSETVTATGDFGQTTTVNFGTPVQVTSTERSVLIPGSGAPAENGGTVLASYSFYDGTTGESLGSQPPGLIPLSSSVPQGIVDGFLCSTPGSRVAIVLDPADAAVITQSTTPSDSMIMVADVQQVYPAAANGADQPVASADLPSVVHGDDGRPGITIPSTPAPTELKVATLKKGDGPVVKDGDSVLAQYTGVLWDGKTVFDSSWANGSPAVLTVSDGSAAGATGGIIPGLATALTGQTVGSEILAVIPPDQGYGAQGSGQAVPPNATLVFVVDILGVLPASAAGQ